MSRAQPDAAAPASAARGTAALEARGLSRRFGAVRAVTDLSFSVAAGELYGLIGPDGAGKTTTLRMLAGLVTPDRGEALVMGLSALSGASVVRESVGYMPQQYSLYGDLSIDENLDFFGRLFGLPKATIAQRKAELLAITQLSRFGARRADALSGGMYKKLALACALLHRPRVLILDEPSNGVDPVSRRELWDLLYTFVGQGMAVILATPYMDEAARCHRVGLLDKGALLAEGAPDALVRSFPHPTLHLSASDRRAAEAALDGRDEVLAVSPHGDDLRVVVRAGALPAFEALAARHGFHIAPALPDFEDVYLGLLAARAHAAAPSPARPA